MEEFKKLRYPAALAIVITFALGVGLMTSQTRRTEKAINNSQINVNNGQETVENSDNYQESGNEVSDVDLSTLAVIEGEFPSQEGWETSFKACAKNITDSQRHCVNSSSQKKGVSQYRLGVPAGTYIIYALHPTSDFVGLYNEQASCDASKTCTRSPIELEVEIGKTYTNINPSDWKTISEEP